MASGWRHTDLDRYLTARLRTDIAARPEPYCADVEVSNTEPDATSIWPARLVVARDDGGGADQLLTGDATVGVTIFAETLQDAMDLALMVQAIAIQVPGLEPGNPVTAVESCTRPVAVPEDQPRHRRYFSITYRVAGVPL